MCSKIFVRIHPVLMILWAKMCKSTMGPMAHVPHGPCALLPIWPIPCPYPLYPIPLYPLWLLPMCSIPPVPHTPVGLIGHVALCPCGSHCPCALYPCTPLPPVSSLPLGPIAHVTHTPCTPLPSLPRWPIAQWGTGVMGNGAIA